MNTKKSSPAWNIAATHWLTSGFVIPFITALIIGFVWGLLFPSESRLPFAIFGIVYLPIIYWLGVMYSARYINKKYIVISNAQIAKLSTIYLFVLGLIYRLFTLTAGGFDMEWVLGVIAFILTVVVFYIATKKYIHADSSVV